MQGFFAACLCGIYIIQLLKQCKSKIKPISGVSSGIEEDSSGFLNDFMLNNAESLNRVEYINLH